MGLPRPESAGLDKRSACQGQKGLGPYPRVMQARVLASSSSQPEDRPKDDPQRRATSQAGYHHPGDVFDVRHRVEWAFSNGHIADIQTSRTRTIQDDNGPRGVHMHMPRLPPGFPDDITAQAIRQREERLTDASRITSSRAPRCSIPIQRENRLNDELEPGTSQAGASQPENLLETHPHDECSSGEPKTCEPQTTGPSRSEGRLGDRLHDDPKQGAPRAGSHWPEDVHDNRLHDDWRLTQTPSLECRTTSCSRPSGQLDRGQDDARRHTRPRTTGSDEGLACLSQKGRKGRKPDSNESTTIRSPYEWIEDRPQDDPQRRATSQAGYHQPADVRDARRRVEWTLPNGHVTDMQTSHSRLERLRDHLQDDPNRESPQAGLHQPEKTHDIRHHREYSPTDPQRVEPRAISRSRHEWQKDRSQDDPNRSYRISRVNSDVYPALMTSEQGRDRSRAPTTSTPSYSSLIMASRKARVAPSTPPAIEQDTDCCRGSNTRGQRHLSPERVRNRLRSERSTYSTRDTSSRRAYAGQSTSHAAKQGGECF